MHELGIVYHIIRDVENVARANGVRRVSSVTLLLGEVGSISIAPAAFSKLPVPFQENVAMKTRLLLDGIKTENESK